MSSVIFATVEPLTGGFDTIHYISRRATNFSKSEELVPHILTTLIVQCNGQLCDVVFWSRWQPSAHLTRLSNYFYFPYIFLDLLVILVYLTVQYNFLISKIRTFSLSPHQHKEYLKP